jgi:SAM-dependent methyltransferase
VAGGSLIPHAFGQDRGRSGTAIAAGTRSPHCPEVARRILPAAAEKSRVFATARHPIDSGSASSTSERSADPPLVSSQASSAGCPPTAPLSTSAAARASRRPRLLSARHRVLGVDLSLVKLRLPRQAAPRAALVRADMTELDLRTGSVDAVASFYALGHVRPAAHAPLLRFIARWLRPGGLLLTSAPLTADDAVDSEWLARRCTSAASGSRPPLPRLRPPAWSSTAAGRTRGQRPSPSPSSPRTRPPHRPPAAPARRPAGTPRPGPARSTTPAAESPARSRPRPLRAWECQLHLAPL